ncbi:iron-containing redox enzyme family protein [Gordonia neofelifaecis]|uniref:Iron-containing redox enzyme family protein n=1 Tax=Gordonia neofelifaecis NRRL B-59395 TaxID=644548 RepID=F1YGV4_9ACTN|nr:hypothetical protein SCNU_05341 [Gordonia neofelifaecis NRRL B-59395]
MPLPAPRGVVSGELADLLVDLDRPAGRLVVLMDSHAGPVLADEDIQISLTMLYELHLRGIAGVDDRAEWDVRLLEVRAMIERRMVDELDALVGPIADPGEVADEMFRIAAADDGPPLARYLATSGSIDQFRELVVHRSLNQLREADVHTLAIPRLAGSAKAALVEVQSDEYGGGRVDFMHATLWADLMDGLGLDSTYASYIDRIPATTLAAVNTLSYLGLHRSTVLELIGHLCMIETTSALPCRDYSRALRRLGFEPAVGLFFDEHVEADSVHEQLVVRSVAGALAESPNDRIALIRGAMICLAVEKAAAEHVWESWEAGRSSLRPAGVR